MTRDDIIRMAREAGFDDYGSKDLILERFAALVADAEREASYELGRLDGANEENMACEQIVLSAIPWGRIKDTAAAIRARRRSS
jgi:hypothetical protein